MITTHRLKTLLAAAAFAAALTVSNHAAALSLGLVQQNANSGARNIAVGSAKASGEDSGNLASGNAINGPALGGKALNFNYGGWQVSVEQDASASAGNFAIGRATAEGADSRNILSGNAINGPAIGGTAVNVNGPGDGLFAKAPPSGSPEDPIDDLGDIPPDEFEDILRRVDNDDLAKVMVRCSDILQHPEMYDQNTIRVCRVIEAL
jgi:hypothetical protein